MLKNWKQKTLLSLDFLTCKMKSKSFPTLLIRLFIKIMTILTCSLSNRPPSLSRQLRKSPQGLRAPEAKVSGSPLLLSPSGLPEPSLRVWLWSKCHSAISKRTLETSNSKCETWAFLFYLPKYGISFGVWQSNVQIAHSCMSLDGNGSNDVLCGSAVGIKWLKI